MSTLRLPVAAAASVIALLSASPSWAQDTTTTTQSTTTQPTSQQPTGTTQPQAATPQPAPVPQQQPISQPVQPVETQPTQTTTSVQTTQPVQPVPTTQPVGSTTTTGYAYGPVPSDRTTERTIEKRPNRALLSTGAGVFVLSYGASVVAGAVSDRDADKKLFIPAVGPWLDLGDRDCSGANPCGSNEDLAKAMIITSGVVQGAGLLMALGSLIIPETTSIEERSTTAKVVKPKLHVTPVSYRSGAGLGAVATF